MKINNSNGRVDLHVHTYFSDGVLSPEEVVEKALEKGLRAISITDHDSVEGVSPAITAANDTHIDIVPGIEISASFNKKKEVHILGYFVDWEDEDLGKALAHMRDKRIERIEKMLELLRRQGMQITREEVLALSPHGTVGRLQLARMLVEKGLVKDLRTVFDRYIGNGKPCHVGHEYLYYGDAIDMIKNAGGVPVLAHPGTMKSDDEIPLFVEAGIRGIEAYHTKHWPSTSNKYTEIAERYGLLVTGGSDCHGLPEDDMLMGKVYVGYETVAELKEESRRIRNEKTS
ncbi:MAG: PHP domain-containing protein [Candidatus Omnitrophica bacterium]|nr:PHP domain-containing protein [Candidatus Omnitrophota bacterium]